MCVCVIGEAWNETGREFVTGGHHDEGADNLGQGMLRICEARFQRRNPDFKGC